MSKVSKISDLGLIRGPFFYVSHFQKDIEDSLASISNFFLEAKFDHKIPKGILMMIQQGTAKPVYATFEDLIDTKVILSAKNVIIQLLNGTNIQD